MSYKLVNAIFRIKLPRAEKQVLQALASHASDDGSDAWPSIKTLAMFTGLSERGVRDALRALEDKNLIAADSGKQGGKHSQTVRYRILFPNTDMVAAIESTWNKTGAVGAPVIKDGGSDCPPTGAVGAGRGAVGAPTGAVGAPKSVIESVIESASFETVKTTTTKAVEVGVDLLCRAYLREVGMSLLVGKQRRALAIMLAEYSPAQVDAAVAEWKARRALPAADIKHPAGRLLEELPDFLVWAKQHELENTVPDNFAAERALKLQQLGITEEEFVEMERRVKEYSLGEAIMQELGLPEQGPLPEE